MPQYSLKLRKDEENNITVDIVLLTILNKKLCVLLNKRGKAPFKEQYTLPGGFIKKNQSSDDFAVEVLKRDSNIEQLYLEQLYSFTEPKRDPRKRIISISYFALIDANKQKLIANAQKFTESSWMPVSKLPHILVGFDHKKIIETAIERVRNKIEYTPLAINLLPKKFTLTELQNIYEIILKEKIDKRNFRKKMMSVDFLKETNEQRKSGRMRPAKLYTYKKRNQFFKK